MKYFFSFLLLFVVLAPCEAQHIKLSLNLKKGNTYFMVGNSNSIILQNINGQENKVNIGLAYRIAFKVINILDSGYSMEVRYQTLNMRIKTANNTVEMDSRKADKQDIPSSIIAAMMNKPFTIIMSRSGKIKSIKNIDAMFNSAFDNFPQVDPVKKAQVKTQLLQTFGGNTFKGNIELQTAVFPEREVIKKEKWTINTKLEGTFKMNVNTIYKLMDASENSYHIYGNGSMHTYKNQKPSQLNGLPVKYNLSGTSIADIKVDKTSGWVSEVKLKQAIKGNIEILDNPKAPSGLNIPMSYITDVITTDK